MYIAITAILVLAIADIALTNGKWLTFPHRYFRAMWKDYRDGMRRDWEKIKGKSEEEKKAAEDYYGEKYK